MNVTVLSKNLKEVEVIPGFTLLVSYQTPVAAQVGNECFITSTNYSQTTTRHVNGWLNGKRAELVPQKLLDNFYGI